MQEQTILSSAARTTTGSSADFYTGTPSGLYVFLNITAASGTTPTLDVKLQGKDPVSGQYFDLPAASFTQKTGTGFDWLLIHPEITTVTANKQVSTATTNNMRLVYTIGGTTPSFTFTAVVQQVI